MLALNSIFTENYDCLGHISYLVEGGGPHQGGGRPPPGPPRGRGPAGPELHLHSIQQCKYSFKETEFTSRNTETVSN